jgi:Cof subfamily protein (haloacid dehalogenase superfamily)
VRSIRLIASDLDGTLLRSDGTVSARTREAIRAAQAGGVRVVFVTARPPRVVGAIVEAAALEGVVICSNGAILYDVARGAIVRHERLAADLAREFGAALRALAPDLVFATEHGHQLGYEPHFPRIFDDGVPEHLCRVDHIHALCDEAITKLIVHHPEQDADALADWIGAHVGERAEVTHSGGPFIEIGAVGVSKASGLRRLCDDLGLTARQVMAFGDMPNDLPMLRFAGQSVAMANAHPAVRAAASEVTASNDEDGVAIRIERLLDELAT